MQVKDIITCINELLAGEQLHYQDLEIFLDKTIDDINGQLNTRYPVFSELKEASDGAPPS
jgi:hypothetical protein